VLVFPLDVDVFWRRITPPTPLGHDGPKSADVQYSVEWRSCNEGVIVSHLSTRENSSAASRARRRHEDIADATVRVAEHISSNTP
jgi:hypothetical protein